MSQGAWGGDKEAKIFSQEGCLGQLVAMWQASLASTLMSPREGNKIERKIPRANVLTYQAGRVLRFLCSCPHTGTYSIVAGKGIENI